ncbi:hypothetical protein QL285_030439 [Trifolium repens]|nr:hypothetical protein QL285_030439 [Trifolium repens]
MNIVIIICLLMFSFFLIVTGRNLSSSPPSLDVNFDAPPVQPNLPPPSPIINTGDVFNPPPSPIINIDDVFNGLENLQSVMANLVLIALAIIIVVFAQTCIRVFQICRGPRS